MLAFNTSTRQKKVVAMHNLKVHCVSGNGRMIFRAMIFIKIMKHTDSHHVALLPRCDDVIEQSVVRKVRFSAEMKNGLTGDFSS